MLVLLGGAARAGKGLISRKLVERTALPLLSLDVLKMGLHHGAPSLGVDPNATSDEVGSKMWPIMRAMAYNALESQLDYIFEGDMLLPQQVAELRTSADGAIHSCFVGYRDAQPLQKLAEIRRHVGLPNDWLSEHDDEYILEQIEFGIRFSQYLASECDRLELEYFDCSADFEDTVEMAVEYLAAPFKT